MLFRSYQFEDKIGIRRAMWGLRPAVTGLIAAAAAIMAIPALFGVPDIDSLTWANAAKSIDIASVSIAVLAGIAVIRLKISPILVIMASGIIGVVLFGVLGL